LLNVPSFWQLVATGVVVILAVFADQATRKRQ
jgi:ribose transport system permease protein